ncbi:MAG: hypothetical protein JSS69_08025 [Acidobacteria bacterium]|nr:hypothetical protein [Acidobacteriota bacterium]MBS1865850.1 hypothetical protein [Acidobacteriota bacterium]
MKLTTGFALAAFFVALPAHAQQQDSQQQSGSSDALAEAARKAKEEKQNAPKPKKVYTEDDISTKKSDISVVGTAPAPSDATPAATDTSTTTPPKGALTPEQKWRKAFGEQRAKIAQAEKELDVLQREENKAGLQYYSDPTKAMKEQLTRDDINQKAAKIDAKKKQIADLKQHMEDMEDQLRKEGGDAGWARE